MLEEVVEEQTLLLDQVELVAVEMEEHLVFQVKTQLQTLVEEAVVMVFVQ
jgi:hypothetical protein